MGSGLRACSPGVTLRYWRPVNMTSRPVRLGTFWRRSAVGAIQQIREVLRRGLHSGHHQALPGAGAGDVEQMALGRVDFLQSPLVVRLQEPRIGRYDARVAAHDGDRAELQALGEMHGREGDGARGGRVARERLSRASGQPDGLRRAAEFALRSGQNADLFRREPGVERIPDPAGDGGGLLPRRSEHVDRRHRPFKDRLDPGPVLLATVELQQARGQKAIGLAADLMRRAVVDLQPARASPDLHALGRPGKGGAEDPLADVAGEEEAVGLPRAGRPQEAELGEAEVLRLVDDDVIEGTGPTVGQGMRYVMERGGVGFRAALGEQASGMVEDRPEGFAALPGGRVLCPWRGRSR